MRKSFRLSMRGVLFSVSLVGLLVALIHERIENRQLREHLDRVRILGPPTLLADLAAAFEKETSDDILTTRVESIHYASDKGGYVIYYGRYANGQQMVGPRRVELKSKRGRLMGVLPSVGLEPNKLSLHDSLAMGKQVVLDLPVETATDVYSADWIHNHSSRLIRRPPPTAAKASKIGSPAIAP
ncbi:MAG: hypothetical protein AAF989_12265 [Planctomycetota bacterium]